MATATINPFESVITETEIAAPRERVFAALINEEQLNRWWTSPICQRTTWKMEARQGGKWEFETTPGSQSINGVNEFKCRGEILDIDPPRLLVYTWIANWNDNPAAVTTVKWELIATSTGTLVRVTHTGLAQQKVARELYRGGWPGVLGNLKTFAEKD